MTANHLILHGKVFNIKPKKSVGHTTAETFPERRPACVPEMKFGEMYMTDQEFRRLTREDLIEIIYEQQKRLEQAEQENERLQQALSAREMKLQNAGSIAEAALALNGVFEAAQAAADDYVAQVRAANEQTQTLCDRLVADARRKADAIVAQAQKQADEIAAMTDEGTRQKWAELQEKTDTMLRSYEALRSVLQRETQA